MCGKYFGASSLDLVLVHLHAKASYLVHWISASTTLEELGVVLPSTFLIYFGIGIIICI